METNRKTLRYLYFCLIDVMFFPYLFHLPIKLSMLVLGYWLIKCKKRVVATDFLVFTFIGIFSVCVGLIKNTESSVIISDVQALVIILYGYLFYRYMENNVERESIDFTGIFLAFLIICSGLMALYWAAPSVFFSIRPFWTLQRTGEVFRSYSINRFTCLVSEPNNMAALTVAVMVYLLFKGNITKPERVVVILLSACLVVSTSSISGTAYYLMAIFTYILFHKKITKKEIVINSKIRKSITPFLFVLVFATVVFILVNIPKILQMDLLVSSTGRYDLYFKDTGSDLSGARSEIWKYYIENHNILFYLLFGDASVGKPHSGHLYVIYAFGLIFYFKFIKVFLFEGKKRIDAIVIRLVFLFVFSMNTLIVDLRSFVIFAALLGISTKNVADNID